MKLDELEVKIHKAIKRAQANGWTIRPGDWYNCDNGKRECCPLTALFMSDRNQDSSIVLGSINILSYLENDYDITISCFTDGFDGRYKDYVMENFRRMYSLGQYFRTLCIANGWVK